MMCRHVVIMWLVWIYSLILPVESAITGETRFSYEGSEFVLLDSNSVLSQRQGLIACMGLGADYALTKLPSARYLQGLANVLETLRGNTVHAWLDGRTLLGVGQVLVPGGVDDTFECFSNWKLLVNSSDPNNTISDCPLKECTIDRTLEDIMLEVCSGFIPAAVNTLNYQVLDNSNNLCQKKCPDDDPMLASFTEGGYEVYFFQKPNCTYLTYSSSDYVMAITECGKTDISQALCTNAKILETTPATTVGTTMETTIETTPEVTTIQTTPEITTPEITTVESTTVAETTHAETTVAETTLPETTLPETTLSETTLFETTLAKTTLPTTAEELSSAQTTSPTSPGQEETTTTTQHKSTVTTHDAETTTPDNSQMTTETSLGVDLTTTLKSSTPSDYGSLSSSGTTIESASTETPIESSSTTHASPASGEQSTAESVTAPHLTSLSGSSDSTTTTAPMTTTIPLEATTNTNSITSGNTTTLQAQQSNPRPDLVRCNMTDTDWSGVQPCQLTRYATAFTLDENHESLRVRVPLRMRYLRKFHFEEKVPRQETTEAPYAAFTGVTMWLFVVLEVMFFLWLDFGPGRRRFPLRKKPLCWCFGRWVRLDPLCDFEDRY